MYFFIENEEVQCFVSSHYFRSFKSSSVNEISTQSSLYTKRKFKKYLITQFGRKKCYQYIERDKPTTVVRKDFG